MPKSHNLKDPILFTLSSHTISVNVATQNTYSEETTRPQPEVSTRRDSVKETRPKLKENITEHDTSKSDQNPSDKTRPRTSKTIQLKDGSTIIIPSPFKRNIYWPGDNEEKKEKKKETQGKDSLCYH